MAPENTLSSLPNRPLTLIEGQAFVESSANIYPVSVIADFPGEDEGGFDIDEVDTEQPLIFALCYNNKDVPDKPSAILGYAGPDTGWVEVQRWATGFSHAEVDAELEQWHTDTYPDIGVDSVNDGPQYGSLQT
jgi:hypothetical protein